MQLDIAHDLLVVLLLRLLGAGHGLQAALQQLQEQPYVARHAREQQIRAHHDPDAGLTFK